MDVIRVISTGDGSHSLMREDLQETYHSIHGAIQESKHVFIEHGLIYLLSRHPGKSVRILELGFGTGLNVLLSLLHASRTGAEIYFESWEKFPVPVVLASGLNHGELLDDAASFQAMHEAAWNIEVPMLPSFTLCKRNGDVLLDPISGPFDLIYYDAFAPSRQPELWTRGMLEKIANLLSPGGVWVSYCAKGQVKRDLASLGLLVESLPGPPGKKEMTRASRPPDTSASLRD